MNIIKKYLPDILAICGYCFMTILFFGFRIKVIGTHYSMPDVDTDGALWQYAMGFFNYSLFGNPDVNHIVAYPFGIDFNNFPIYSLIYDIGNIIYKGLGGGYLDLIFMSNILALIQYPLTGYVMFRLSKKFTDNNWIAYIGGLLFAFAYHQVLFARASLSLNHFYLIPLFFIFLINYIRDYSWKNVIKLSLCLGFIFMANPYYVFYSMVFTPLWFWILIDKPFLHKIKIAMRFYIVGFISLICINASFIYQQYTIQFNRANIETLGRGFDPISQVTKLSSLFTRSELIPSSERFITYGYWIGIISLVCLFISLFFIRLSNKYYKLFILCFLLSIFLCAYVPGFFWVPDTFLKIFPMFKSISRFSVYGIFYATLIAVLLFDILIKRFSLSYLQKIGFIILCMSIVYFDSYPRGATTRYHTTDFTKIIKLYEPIRDNKEIQVIAGYPMTLYGGKGGGVPPTYEILGQIIHGKKLVGGLDPFNQTGAKRYTSIQDITHKDTIINLSDQGVDTIILYKNIINFYYENGLYKSGFNDIHKTLVENKNIKYIGNYNQPIDDKMYYSWKDRSQDFNVYKIKNPGSQKLYSIQSNIKRSNLIGFGILSYFSIIVLFIFSISMKQKKYFLDKI